MENKNKKCFFKDHNEIEATNYCIECKIYMCNKCEIFHSKLFKNHRLFTIEENLEEIFTGFCNEEKHDMELEYFCKNHSILCCAACISKIKKNKNGKHKDCDICLIEDIKEEKLNKLNENINILENLSNTIEKSINDIKIYMERINIEKEELKNKIQKMFTKIRNELNNREDELLLEVDKKYDNIYFKEEIIKNIEKLPDKIKISLEKGKSLNKDYQNNQFKLSLLMNECLNIENNIKEINVINQKINKCNNLNNFKINLNIETEQGINNFIKKIKTFGKCPIKIKDYKLKKELNLNTGGICSLIILSNKDIAIGTRSGELIIFNLIDLKEIVRVKAHSNGNTSIYSMLELSDTTIITCGGNKTMKNYKYIKAEKKLVEIQELFCKNNSSYICRVVELPNKNLVSSDNYYILIWKKNVNNKFEIIKEISDFGGVMQHLILINEKYIVCHNNSGVLRIYNSLDGFKLEKEIKNIISYAYMHRFCIINSDIFCLSGDAYIYLFSIRQMDLIQSFKVEGMKFHSIITLPNNTILCGANGCHFFQFKIDENYQIKEISKKENVHSSIIWQLAYFNNEEYSNGIISVSDDSYLKMWELDYLDDDNNY